MYICIYRVYMVRHDRPGSVTMAPSTGGGQFLPACRWGGGFSCFSSIDGRARYIVRHDRASSPLHVLETFTRSFSTFWSLSLVPDLEPRGHFLHICTLLRHFIRRVCHTHESGKGQQS